MILTRNRQVQHSSIYEVKIVKYNVQVKDHVFTTRYLGKKIN